MHLSESEVERFYAIWFPLLHFVKQYWNVVPEFTRSRRWHVFQFVMSILLIQDGHWPGAGLSVKCQR
jgi:hypothetical protein